MPPRLLLVDDDDAIRDMVGTALRSAGFETTVAVDGRDALARLAEMTPDLIVLDVLMPGLDGLEVCRRLRGRGETTPITPWPPRPPSFASSATPSTPWSPASTSHW
ncbi:hypothetical protein CC117_09365 [Parafrankia colletiae]|uniref:Response regulatory domain-containing protein n=1 Tax=Parafrankia colletiae TaxID=573497 RepID=A0A1S1RJI8_9ACTN|nr:response regulator [Parafrankia colletiae]MCK9899288.1 response regulator [Frankia sp. Cpl3]OHV45949.1 hypothetical protein CC117_09365 [Parafrankia colletiae]